MNSRDLRLLGLAAAGLSLVLVARGAEESGNHDAFTIEDPSVKDPSVVVEGSATAPDAIRLLDFTEIDQPGRTCVDVLAGDAPRVIQVSEGRSATIDKDKFVKLEIDGDVVYGDVDDDGFDEAVVHTKCEYGANGVQDTIQIWDLDSGSAEIKATLTKPPAAVDNVLEPTVKDVAIEDGKLTVTWTQFADDDPRCCPSLQSKVHFMVAGDEVIPVGTPEVTTAPA